MEIGENSPPTILLLENKYLKNTGWNMWTELQEALENLNLVSASSDDLIERLPTETFQFDERQFFKEGKVVQVFVNRYERSQKARLECIKNYGDNCHACGFNFGHFMVI